MKKNFKDLLSEIIKSKDVAWFKIIWNSDWSFELSVTRKDAYDVNKWYCYTTTSPFSTTLWFWQ